VALVLAGACGGGWDAGEERTSVTLPAEGGFAVLPTRGVERFDGSPSAWRAATDLGRYAVELEAGAGDYAQVRDRLPELVTVEGDGAPEAIADELLPVPVATWDEAAADPDARVDLERRTIDLGPFGPVERALVGSVSEGFVYRVAGEDLGAQTFDVCASCDGEVTYGTTVPVGGGYARTYVLPPGSTDLATALSFWAVDDELLRGTLLVVYAAHENSGAQMTFTDAAGEERRFGLAIVMAP
jgi:hypothetical protein